MREYLMVVYVHKPVKLPFTSKTVQTHVLQQKKCTKCSFCKVAVMLCIDTYGSNEEKYTTNV